MALSKLNETIDDWDVSLYTEATKLGKDYSYNDSFKEAQEGNDRSIQVGLALNIPLGSTKNNSESIKKLMDKKRLVATQEMTTSKLNSFHTQIVTTVKLLQDVVRNQQINSKKLSHSLKISDQKYKQARIDVSTLILDQDAYLQSNISELDTKLSVINTLLDYFSVFTETPCSINRI